LDAYSFRVPELKRNTGSDDIHHIRLIIVIDIARFPNALETTNKTVDSGVGRLVSACPSTVSSCRRAFCDGEGAAAVAADRAQSAVRFNWRKELIARGRNDATRGRREDGRGQRTIRCYATERRQYVRVYLSLSHYLSLSLSLSVRSGRVVTECTRVDKASL